MGRYIKIFIVNINIKMYLMIFVLKRHDKSIKYPSVTLTK